ncbi:hypothetical protein [Campylobacter suis]|uniref:hypothetical protein n=1 Tax=Campylobacter suis TaxID=2790657 RepID=UPI001E52B13F|nr:hypothetical protein [Campylobacter suis]
MDKKDIEQIIAELSKISDNINKYSSTLNQENLDGFADFVTKDKNFAAFFLAVLRSADFGDIAVQNGNPAALMKSMDKQIMSAIVVLYCVLLKIPKNRKIVTLSAIKLVETNAKLLVEWKKILKFLGKYDQINLNLVCYTFIVVFMLEHAFEKEAERLGQILALSDMSYYDAFKNLYDIDIFEVICTLAGFDTKKNSEILQYLKMLLLYRFGRPEYANSNLTKILSFSKKPSLQDAALFKRALQ